MCAFCNKRPHREGSGLCHTCRDNIAKWEAQERARKRKPNPFRHAEVIIKWRGVVVIQRCREKGGGCQRIANAAYSRLPKRKQTCAGWVDVIDLDVFQPTLHLDQIKRYKRILRKAGA